MSVTDGLELTGGIIVLIAVFYDLLQTVVLPRPNVGKVALVRYFVRWLWRRWRWVGMRTDRVGRRENVLSAFGPIAVLIMFALWALAIIVGYALVLDAVHGLHPPSRGFGDSLYVSATTLVPLSYGDVVPLEAPARIAIVLESATGIILSALVITLLFSLYQSFQAREEIVVTLDALAGAPPSGVQLLETARLHDMGGALERTFDEWQRWSAAVLESHLAYPILVYFRSSHDNEAWLNSFGAVMDAAVLVLSTVEAGAAGPAKLMLTVGNHLVADMSHLFRLTSSPDPYVERSEFEEAAARLGKAGYVCRADEVAWEHFAGLRAAYARPLSELARLLAIIPAQWISDRSYLPHQGRPQAAAWRGGTALRP